MRILLATIEHSGTHFTMTLLDKYVGATELASEDRDELKPPPPILYAHLTDERMPLIREAVKRMPVITTHRDPEQIRASWMRRGMDLARLEEQFRNYEELLTLRPKPAIMDLWGGWGRLPPQTHWFDDPPWTVEQVDAHYRRHGHRM